MFVKRLAPAAFSSCVSARQTRLRGGAGRRARGNALARMDRLESASAGFAHAEYRFGGFRLDAGGTLYRGETPIPLSLKELAALRLLLAHPGRIVTPLELQEALWGDAPVMADSVSKCLASLRRKLEPETCLETVFKRGYRLAVAVRALGEPSGPLPRLAILPFTAERGIPEYLGAAVAEEAGERIGRAQPAPASIVARDSVFTLARRSLAPRQIGEMLKADLVLCGSLRALPAHYRLRAEMVHAADGSQAWVEDLLVERNRIAGLESELAHRTCQRLQAGGLSIVAAAAARGDEPVLEPEAYTRRLETYEILQRARYEWQTMERHRMQDALQHLQRTLDLDPALSPARVEVARLCATQALYGFMPPGVAADLAHRAAQGSGEAAALAEGILPVLAWISFHVDRDLGAALRLLREADRPAYDPWLTRMRTLLALSRRRFAEAIDLLQSAIRVDPWSPWPQARLAWAHHLAGDAVVSVEAVKAALERFPLHEGVQLYGAYILAFNGKAAQAAELAGGLAQRLPYFDLAMTVHAYALAMAGERDAARAILERLEWLSRERYVLKSFSASAYVALGEHENALAALRSADEARCPWFFQMLADPQLKPLQESPEFRSMLDALAAMEAGAESSGRAESGRAE